jgi:hydroxylysine kinase
MQNTPGDNLFNPPSLSIRDVSALARSTFGIKGTMTPLRGEREQNTAITTAPGEAYVLKIARLADADAIDFQTLALQHIARVDPELGVPHVVPTLDGKILDQNADAPDGGIVVRLLTFLAGSTFDDAGTLTPAGLAGVGAVQARVSDALGDFDHPAADTRMPWALDSGSLNDAALWDSLDDDARRLAEPCRDRVEETLRQLSTLRRQVIHGDAHRGNLLRVDHRSEAIVGMIDFGDLSRSAVVADLGISGASFLGDQDDPVAGLIALTSGYHRVRRLDVAEAALVPELVLCRMVLSTLMTDYQRRYSPHIAADVDAERPGVLRSLQRWSAIDPHDAADRLLEALAMTGRPD